MRTALEAAAAEPSHADTADGADADHLLYKQAFDNAIVGICFMVERRFVRVNRRMEEMLGYAPGELAGQSVRVVYARDEDYDEVGRVVAAFPRNNRYVHERPLVTRTGDLLWCLISGRKVNPLDPRSASVWVVQDITGKKRAEDELARTNQRLEQTVQRRTVNLQKTNEALRNEVERRRASERAMIESREKYRVLICNIPLGIVITDAGGEAIEINPAMQAFTRTPNLERFLAVAAASRCSSARDGSSMTLLELIHQRAACESRRPEHVTVRWQAPDGEMLWFDVVGVRVPVRGLGAAVVFADRTEQRKARSRELAQQQRLAHAARLSLMGQFASALAHELGQPLNACLSYAAGIEHRLAGELRARPDARDALQHIQLHLTQAGDVIRNVRSFIAQHRPDDEVIDLQALIHTTLDLLQMQMREAAVQVTVTVPDQLPPIRGTRVELQQVLVNLLLNAAEAMRAADTAGRRIAIKVSVQRRRGIAIAVADNGPGVPEKLRADIFRPYTTTKKEGLGMGLMMCRTIVESHGGELRLDARRRRGATFRFTLPAAAERA